MYLPLLFLISLLLIYFYLKYRYDYWKRLGVKTAKSFLIFGSLTENVLGQKSFADMLKDFYQEFKTERYFGFYQFLEPVLILRDINLIKKIAVKDFDIFIDRQSVSREDVDPLFSKSLIAISGNRWRDMRTILSPAFTGNKMKSMFYLVNECSQKFVDHLKEMKKDLVTLEMKDTLSRVTNDMIANCAFGITCDSFKEPKNEFYLVGKDAFLFEGAKQLLFFMFSATPDLMKFLGLRIFNNRVSTFFSNIIKISMKTRKEQKIIRPDMVHLLLEAQKGKLKNEESDEIFEESFASNKDYMKSDKQKNVAISDDDIFAQCILFSFAGFETTSGVLSNLFYELAVNPEIQIKLREEILGLEEELNYENIMKFKYMDMVVSEGLRKWPAVPFLDRRCTQDYIIEAKEKDEKDLLLKKGSVIWIPAFALQRDPKHYPEPDKFIPERFSHENKENFQQFAYAPFGLGPRNCIGSRFALMEIKAILYHLLQNFEIIPVEETVIPMKISKKHLNLHSENGLKLGLKKINK